jgi:hypothetical protein
VCACDAEEFETFGSVEDSRLLGTEEKKVIVAQREGFLLVLQGREEAICAFNVVCAAKQAELGFLWR